MKLKILALLAATALPATGHAAQFLKNGNIAAGLTSFGSSGTVGANPGSAYVLLAGGTGSAAAQANMFVSFGGANIGGLDTLSQSFSTLAGKSYSLSFDSGTFGLVGQALTVTVGDVAVPLISSGGTLDLDQVFKTTTFSFVGTGSPMEILFSVQSVADDNMDVLLDNISISAVPEPATWSLLIMGFAMTGFALRRRNAVALN